MNDVANSCGLSVVAAVAGLFAAEVAAAGSVAAGLRGLCGLRGLRGLLPILGSVALLRRAADARQSRP